MVRDDNRARGDRSLSKPGGSSFGHVQLSDAPRVCEAQAVGTGVKFRHRIGGTAATDDRPHELREQGQMASGAVTPAELDLRLGPSEGAICATASGYPFIVKPFTPDAFAARVRSGVGLAPPRLPSGLAPARLVA